MTSRVTVAGDIGSGKTTVAKRLAGIIGVELLSIGTIQRELAKSKGVNVLELNQFAESDRAIDQEIDSYLMDLPPGDLVAESRLAWHFIPDTTKVYLYISNYEAARRIVNAKRSDENYGEGDALGQILARRQSEVRRFKKYYDVDIEKLDNYDMVIDTTFASIDEVIRKISKNINAPSKDNIRWINPRNLVPTQSIRDLSEERVNYFENEVIAHGYDRNNEILGVYVDHVFYVVDGHARAAAAIRNKLTFVPVRIVASGDEIYTAKITARCYVQDAVSDSRIYDWEDAVGFRFQDKIWKSGAALVKT